MEEIKDILDQIQLWHLCIGAYILGVIWMVWEASNAPLMPDDYDLSIEEEEILKDIQKRNDNDFEDDYENQPFAD